MTSTANISLDKNFNIRVYALLINSDNLLVCKEQFMGGLITKLPGGGMEYGEGALDCLHRELAEELNLKADKVIHHYTTDFFIQSKRSKSEQLFVVYYKVWAHAAIGLPQIVNPTGTGEAGPIHLEWIPIKELSVDIFDLEADKEAIRRFLL